MNTIDSTTEISQCSKDAIEMARLTEKMFSMALDFEHNYGCGNSSMDDLTDELTGTVSGLSELMQRIIGRSFVNQICDNEDIK